MDILVIKLFVFQQSKSYVFCAAIQFPRQSAGHSSCAKEGPQWFVDAVVHDSCPWSRQCGAVAFTDKVVDIPVLALRIVEVPQIQSSTELNDNLEAHFAPFFGLTRKGLSPGVRGFFEPSTMKSSSSSRAPCGGGVAGSLTPR